MAIIENHGGACCGVRHIHEMDNTSVEEFSTLVRHVDGLANGGGNRSSRLIEVILSERQVTGNRNDPSVVAEGGWPVVLRRHGFRLVSAFNNANTARNCYVFHRADQRTTLPFEWPEFHGQLATRRPAAVQVPVTDVAQFYQNVFANGRRGALYTDRENARVAAPRCRRMDRITVRSDGTRTTEENV